MKKLFYLFLGIIGISSCTNDNFVEPSTETTRAEIIHEKLTYEQFSKKVDEKNDFDKSLKHSFQENYISSTKGLVKIANTDEGDSEILIDYFFDPVHGNETYSFITHEFTGETENDYLEKFVLTIEDGEGERTAFLRYYPAVDFSSENFKGKIEMSNSDRTQVEESYLENGIPITNQGSNYQTNGVNGDCITVFTFGSTKCTNGGNHPYGVKCPGKAPNDAYIYVKRHIECDGYGTIGAPNFPNNVIEPYPGKNGGGYDPGLVIYDKFTKELTPQVAIWIKQQPNIENMVKEYLTRNRFYPNAEDLIVNFVLFIANDEYLKYHGNQLTELVVKEALNGNKFTTTEFINFWGNLTSLQKNIFKSYVAKNLKQINGTLKLTPEAEAFLSWAFNYLIDNPTVTVEQFENWFMMKSEGRDFFYDANYWENPNLTFPQQNLPKWSKFLAAYPNETSQQLYGVVGGEVAKAQIKYPKETENGCALKVSVALNGAGIIIPNIPSTGTMPGTVQGGDGNYYFLNAKSLNIWMRKTFGVSPANSKHHHFTAAQGGVNGNNFLTLIQNQDKTYMKGIYSMVSTNPQWASGHADILRSDGTCKAGCHFQDNPPAPIDYIDIWILD